jgi:hypothetical protein
VTESTARRPKPPEPTPVPDATPAWAAHVAAGGRAVGEWPLMRAGEACVRGTAAVGSVEGWVSRPGGVVELVRVSRAAGGRVVGVVVGRAKVGRDVTRSADQAEAPGSRNT